MPMLSQTLQRLLDERKTSVHELAELSGVAASTVYRWISGESEPDFRAIRLLLRHLPDREAQQQILSAFTAGTVWQCYHLETELDVNNDGCIDANDALDASIKAVYAAGESLRQVRDACKDGVVPPAQAGQVIAQLHEVVHACTVTQQVLTRLSEQRKKARA